MTIPFRLFAKTFQPIPPPGKGGGGKGGGGGGKGGGGGGGGGGPLIDHAWAQMSTSGGVPTIDNDINMDSVVDNGVGDFTFNIATDMTSASYAITSTARVDDSGTHLPMHNGLHGTTQPTAALFRMATGALAGGAQDPAILTVLATRNADAWAEITVTTGVPAITDSVGIDSLVDNGAGDVTCNLDPDFADANYAALGQSCGGDETTMGHNGAAPTAAAFRTIAYRVSAGTSDPFSYHLMAINDVASANVTAWGAWNYVGGVPTLLADKGIDSLTDVDVGDVTVNWDPDFLVATYAVGTSATDRHGLKRVAPNPAVATTRTANDRSGAGAVDAVYNCIVATVVA
jgi:hypothetical protein